jgi:iron complex outermembrane receptor protein
LDLDPGPTTRIEAQQLTPGIGYEGVWRDVGQLSVGVQRAYYDRTVYAPGAAPISGKSKPWLYYLAGAVHASSRLAVYASFTRGFEEIGNAPFNAANRDEVVPAQLTEQIDAGVRYQLTPRLTLVGGVFQIEKPYFDLDENNVYRRVGDTSNRGVELSLAGALTDRLTVVAGVIAIDPKVSYDTGEGSEERTAVGPAPGLIRANLQYRVAAIEGLTLDAKVESMSKRYARYNSVQLPAVTTIDAGLRYDTQVLGRNATLRLQLFNLTNEFSLTPNASGQLTPLDSRRFDLSFAFDI